LVDESQYAAMRWRLLGPHRGGRVTSVAGVPGDPTTYYMGLPGGGVFKTTDGGITWAPIFDAVHVASVGALALAPSRPSTVYVGTGEMGEGNGVWRSDDAGATWRNVGLGEVKVISCVRVAPGNPDEVLVGGQGSVVEPSAARGVFRTTDGGASWTKVLYRDEYTGVTDIAVDPGNPQQVYATLRRGAFGKAPGKQPDAWIFKSTDGGKTWTESGNGLPGEPTGRIGVAVAPGGGGRRVYAILRQGLFRSDDAGSSWRAVSKDTRVVGSEGFSKLFVDPVDPERVWVIQTSLYLSKDGGVTFEAAKGAPGGDDYRAAWIDPQNPRRMILGVDQGATITLNAGGSWTPWFNQATGQLYHVSTDDQTPYYVYAEQQDSGTVAVPNSSDYGQITFRDWFSVGGFEFGYIAPDPLRPNIVYSTGWYGTVVRFDRTTGQITAAFEPGERYREARAGGPLLYSPRDRHILYHGAQFLLQTKDGGNTWTEMSPDLTAGAAVETEPDGSPIHYGISAIAPSPLREGPIWVGTSNGLVHHTSDEGHTWTRDAIPAGAPKMAVLMMEASPHDPAKAFVVLRPRGGVFDHAGAPHFRPLVYRTTDSGTTWREITAGLPGDDLARAVREDPSRKGLLYLATDTGVYVSFSDGDRWQALQLNLPTTSVRDLAAHGEDLVAATFGRGLWVLDNLEPLRQAAASRGPVELLKPPKALRLHWDNNQETPLPPEVPAAPNPPSGLIVDYVLRDAPRGEVTLEIRDQKGKPVRKFSSAPPPPDVLPRNVPDYWFGPPQVLSTHKGHNRFVWNLRTGAPPALTYSYAGKPLPYMEYTLVDDAILGRTPREQPQGPLVLPGRYEAVLTVDGTTSTEPFEVELDPRVKLEPGDLARHYDLSVKIALWMEVSFNGAAAVAKAEGGGGPKSKASDERLAKLHKANEGTEAAPGFGPINRSLARLLSQLDEGDARPGTTVEGYALALCRDLRTSVGTLREVWGTSAIPGVPTSLDCEEPGH
jgi:photosystem II stability/assembly factor-like uncharacterized protein